MTQWTSLPAGERQEPMIKTDVIIVGAGFTGLSAASALAGAGLDLILLEARARVGGKVESTMLPGGTRVDTGGQFFCRDMREIMALISAQNRTPVMTHYEGNTVYRPPIAQERGNDRSRGVDALRDRMIATDPDDPELAKLTVADWVTRQEDIATDVRKSFLRLIKGLWCRSPEEVSFIWLASNDRRITNTYSEMEMFLPETVHAVAENLAEELGGRLRLATPATRIEHSKAGITVTAGAERFSARRLLLALPPVMIRKLDFAPALPDYLLRALDAWSPGLSIKVQVTYDRPFWRERGLSGAVMWQEPQGLYACDASRGDYAGLVIFIGGPEAAQWHGRPQQELIDFIREQLTEAFGPEGGLGNIHIRDWVNDEWSGGAYSDVVTHLNALDTEEVLRRGLASVRFASSELALSYPGYIEGAIVAGRKVATEIAEELGLEQGYVSSD
jgi:monoamine oxidase